MKREAGRRSDWVNGSGKGNELRNGLKHETVMEQEKVQE